jgi:cytochrome b pre-mRNA-processing protein 3
MFGALRRWFIPRPPEAVAATYIALVAAARNPFFYTDLAVPDTLDGRFDLIVLHLFLLQHRLVTEKTPESEKFGQFLSEAFFADMDSSLREIGVADTGVSHRIKKMGKAYHGRLQAYTAGLGDAMQLRSAIARNLYGTVAEGDVKLLDRVALYIGDVVDSLNDTGVNIILEGNYRWPDVSAVLA